MQSRKQSRGRRAMEGGKGKKNRTQGEHPYGTKCDQNVLRAFECHYYFSCFVLFLFLTGLAARLPCE